MTLKANSSRFKVNRGFERLTRYIKEIDSHFPDIATVIQNRRNDIRVDKIDGLTIVAKSFKGMYWPNRLAYSLFRKSKARRSFETSLRLSSMGFPVPTPVAYVDYYRWGILQSSYFISLYQSNEDLPAALARHSALNNLPKSLAGFLFQMHQAGINHYDLSKGNILCVSEGERIRFYMVDLNRVRFQPVNYRQGLKCLSRLGIDQTYFNEVVEHYSALSGKSFDEALGFMRTVKNSRDRSRAIRLSLKRVFFPSRVSVNRSSTPGN